MTPAKAVRSNPLTPLRKKQSSDHFALMLGDSVMINDGVLGTHSPPTTSDLMFDGDCRWKLKFSCKPMRVHAYSCGYGLPSTLRFPQVSCRSARDRGIPSFHSANALCW